MTPRVWPFAPWLFVNSAGRAAVSRLSGRPEAIDAWTGAIQERVRSKGKFSKWSVRYEPIAPPPVVWEYNCGSCLFFQRATASCQLVKSDGHPNPGKIHPQGWCALWTPLPDARPFAWVKSWLRGQPGWVREPPPEFP